MQPGGAEKKPVRVTIFHQPYTLRASGDPAEIEGLARSVDDLMAAIAAKTGEGDGVRVAVLACLHLADRLQDLEHRLAALEQRVDRKSRELSALLDAALEQPVLPPQRPEGSDVGD
jgi:cell division protein ZapA